MSDNGERDLSSNRTSSADRLQRCIDIHQAQKTEARLRKAMSTNSATTLSNRTKSTKSKRGDATSGSKTRCSGDRAQSSTDKYKRKGYSGSGYSNKKSSDDYIRKKQLEEAALNAHGLDDMCKPVWYYVIFGLSVLLLIGLTIALILVGQLAPAEDNYTQTRVLSREVDRKQLSILSDNLDCSILMKRFILHKINVPATFISGLMCLYMTEPHSVAPDSAISFLFFTQQGAEKLAKTYENGLLRRWEFCYSFNKSVELDNSECHAFSFFRITTSYSTHSRRTRIADSALQSYSHFHWRDYFYSQYGYIFQRFSRLVDSGAQPLYPEAARTAKYPQNEVKNGAVSTVFPVSEQLERFVSKYKPAMTKWNKNIFGNTTIDPLKYGDRITVTKNAARHVVNGFLYSNRSRGVLREKFGEVIIRKSQKDLHLIYPIGAQNSAVISTFIVKVVWEALKDHMELITRGMESEKETKLHTDVLEAYAVDLEMKFYAAVLAAQRFTYQTLPETKEWNPKKNKKMLMAFQNRVIRKLKKFLIESSSLDVPKAELVMRKRADRVASLIVWHHTKGDNLVVLNIGLPRPFNSSFISGKTKKSSFPSFYSKKMGKSAPFTSASSIIVLETPPNREVFDQDKPKVVATASGSLRTVEAVATAVLRTLVFDEDSGAAVDAPSAYVSLFDGSFRCEYDRYMPRMQMTFKTFLEQIKEDYGINCRDVNKKRFAETDRMAMVVTHGGTSDAYMKASIDDRNKGHNYATGF